MALQNEIRQTFIEIIRFFRQKNSKNQQKWVDSVKLGLNSLPEGLVSYLSQGAECEIETGKLHLISVEAYLADLISLCGRQEVGDSYRRDISSAKSERNLSELFCEIALCATLGKYAKKIKLRPPSGKGTFSDCMLGYKQDEIFCEAKRYEDSWPSNAFESANENHSTRSIYKSQGEDKPANTRRPRFMEIQNKLRDVHRQFPDNTMNILFIFHPSIGQSKNYLFQAILGEENFWKNDKDLVLDHDGLFAQKHWENISACCLTVVRPSAKVMFPAIIVNPNARNPVPADTLIGIKLA